MDKLDKQLKIINDNSGYLDPVLYCENNYLKFGYEDEDEMELDLNILLAVKYKRITKEDNLDNMLKKELQQRCKKLKIVGYSRMNKDELKEIIRLKLKQKQIEERYKSI